MRERKRWREGGGESRERMQMMPTLGILVKMTFGPDKQGWQAGRAGGRASVG